MTSLSELTLFSIYWHLTLFDNEDNLEMRKQIILKWFIMPFHYIIMFFKRPVPSL